MPPRNRTRASKALKENIDVTGNKLKPTKSNTKAPRKALADKTNSASDDASLEIQKSKTTITKSSKPAQKQNGVKNQNLDTKQNSDQTKKARLKQKTVTKENVEPINEARPRRQRRLPPRFVENQILNNLSNNKDSVNTTHNSSITRHADNGPAKNESLSKNENLELSPFKTPAKAETSLRASRPRRIGRLPSRFEDHSTSPHKYIPIQPANASTPIQQSKTKPVPTNGKVDSKVGKDSENKKLPNGRPSRLVKIHALVKESSDNSSDKSSPDSNNNAKGKSTRVKKGVKNQSAENTKQSPINTNHSPIKKFFTSMNRTKSPITKTQSETSKTHSPVKNISLKHSSNGRKIKDKNLSPKVLGSKKTSQEGVNNDFDIYEFTFDPKEEPQPQKKKRKKPVIKKPSNPKPKRVHKSNYDQNISKALAVLKTAVKPGKSVEVPKLPRITENIVVEEIVHQKNVTNNVNIVQNTKVNTQNVALNDTGKNSVHECNYPSIRVEDIAADIEPSIDHHDINYSPVNSPSPNGSMTHKLRENPNRSIHNNDPLNLQEDLSFFDDQPVASSSMNMSVRHPLASPWRVEFGSLPIKWPVNAYVKPNMTPAVESSFISAEDSNKKKHVYTNMLPPTNDTLPEIVDNTPSFKQTSILSFIKEMAEKSAKKKRGRSVSPSKAIYEEIIGRYGKTSKIKKSTKKVKDIEEVTPSENTSEEGSGTTNDTSNDKENSEEERRNRKRKNEENICDRPAKSPRKQKDSDCTYFGFDESENQEQENVSPIKINNNPKRSLRPRTRAVLQEINGPTRAVLPVAAKTKIAASSDAVNRVYEELKSAADAPLFPEKNIVSDNIDNATNIENPSSNEDSQSVHLFEDIEVVHHLKPTRKSYGKAKKVTFRQHSKSDSDTRGGVVASQNYSSDYDDLGDLTFEIPNVQEKKTTKKKKPKNLRSKKEEQEAEAWAANFNSMCEDIEEYTLLHD